MNRKQFLRSCAGGLCSCVAAGVMTPAGAAAAATPQAEDWRLGFVRRRYARLIEILSGRMDERALIEILHELGAYCATTDPTLPAYRGDFEGYRKHVRQTASGDDVTYDRKQGIVTMSSPERADCFCPLISRRNKTPTVVCNCSLGWQQRTWETVLGKKVRVELKESVLRGGNRCVFQIHVSDEAV